MSFSANSQKFYIDGQWVAPAGSNTLDVINPATEAPFMTIAMGGKADVDRAVAAARKAFETWAFSSRDDRLALLRRVQRDHPHARIVSASSGKRDLRQRLAYYQMQIDAAG